MHHDEDAQVYLNGVKIGQTGKLDQSDRGSGIDYYRQLRSYTFPANLIQENNTLAVRVHDDMGHGGIYEGPVGIMTSEDYAAFWKILRESRKGSFKSTMDWLLGN